MNGYEIRTDYRNKGAKNSGQRSLSKIRIGVLHDMEVADFNRASEMVGRYFNSKASAGSSHYGVDNDSIQQYLTLDRIPWGSPGANLDGVHIEQMGLARWSHSQWLYRAGEALDRTAFLIAKLSLRDEFDLPIHHLSNAELAGGKLHGWVTHWQVSAVFHGTHTDPGRGYPLSFVLERAKRWRERLD